MIIIAPLASTPCGGGVDGQYFPLQYLGLAVEGNFFNEIPGDFFGSTVTGNLVLRYPLDNKYPNLHLAPYVFGGVGGTFNESNHFTPIVGGSFTGEAPVTKSWATAAAVSNTVLHHTLDCLVMFATTLSMVRETTSCRHASV
jgi:hypothetical protein